MIPQDLLAGLPPEGFDASVGELRKLNQALRASAMLGLRKGGVNYPLQGVGYDSGTLPGGEFAPLVPQSIQPMLDNATFDDEHIVAWKLLAKTSASSPMHEYNVRRSYGSAALNPFVREGGVPAISESSFERKVIRVKYAATFRQITDVASMTGMMHPSPQAISIASMDGMMELVQKMESYLFHGDSSVNPLEFDGIYKSIRAGAPSNFRDAEGSVTSLEELQEIIGRMTNPPYYAKPTEIWCDHRVWTNLQNQMLSKYGRMEISQQRDIYGGVGKLFVSTAHGNIPILSIPFLAHREHPISRPEGDAAPAVIVPTVAYQASVTGSKFKTADVTGKDFHYIVEAVGDEGVVNFAATAAVSHSAAGGSTRFTINDAGVPSFGSNSIRYYNVFRADVATGAGAPADPNDFWFVGRFARNLVASGTHTRFDEINEHRPQKSPVYILTNRRDCMEWVNFLDLTRRPITVSRSATTQFMIMLFGALKMGVPQKHWILDNVGYT